MKEIETTANLQHPHILPLFDSGRVEGTVFYVMPYVQGESLRARLDRETQLPVADAIRIATEVAAGLDYAHRHGVIHRDIKPDNVLFHDGRALVADFGIALAWSDGDGRKRLTRSGVSLGTPQYMSPEQASGDHKLDPRSDVYALIAPHRSNRRRPKTQDGRPLRRYRRRWKMERLHAWLQNYRRVLVRWEYHLENFLGFVQLACVLILLRHL